VHPDKRRRFDALVARQRDRAVRVAFRMLGGDEAGAHDCAQEAFLRAWTHLGDFRDEAALDTWFFRILLRQISNHRRREQVFRGFRDVLRLAPPPAPPAQREFMLHAPLIAAIGELSAGQRAVFVLVYLEDFTIDEAADALGCAGGTARSHLHRALATVRAALARTSP
jgi:RNA polymerase sigma-70 factor (ECF subfamily)